MCFYVRLSFVNLFVRQLREKKTDILCDSWKTVAMKVTKTNLDNRFMFFEDLVKKKQKNVFIKTYKLNRFF